MMDREGKLAIVSCDKCPEAIEAKEGEEFKDFWSRVKSAGWKARQIKGKWLHGCPDCGAPK